MSDVEESVDPLVLLFHAHNICYQSASIFYVNKEKDKGEKKHLPSNKSCHFFFFFPTPPPLLIYLFITASSFGKTHYRCKDEGEFRSKPPWGLIPSILSSSFFLASSSFQIIPLHSWQWTKWHILGILKTQTFGREESFFFQVIY